MKRAGSVCGCATVLRQLSKQLIEGGIPGRPAGRKLSVPADMIELSDRLRLRLIGRSGGVREAQPS